MNGIYLLLSCVTLTQHIFRMKGDALLLSNHISKQIPGFQSVSHTHACKPFKSRQTYRQFGIARGTASTFQRNTHTSKHTINLYELRWNGGKGHQSKCTLHWTLTIRRLNSLASEGCTKISNSPKNQIWLSFRQHVFAMCIFYLFLWFMTFTNSIQQLRPSHPDNRVFGFRFGVFLKLRRAKSMFDYIFWFYWFRHGFLMVHNTSNVCSWLYFEVHNWCV